MVHWLVLDELQSNKGIYKSWKNLKEYREKYPSCNITVYNREYSMNDRIIRLECNQAYNDLDLDVNSMSDGSLRKLTQKPKDIILSKFQVDYFIDNYVAT